MPRVIQALQRVANLLHDRLGCHFSKINHASCPSCSSVEEGCQSSLIAT